MELICGKTRGQPNLERVALIIPTLNAGGRWNAWWNALSSQTLQPDCIFVIDSSSDDGTLRLASERGAVVKSIERQAFNHGATRQLAVDLLPLFDYYVFLTQDAIFADVRALELLLTCFTSPRVGMVYGRQLPRQGAGPCEKHARLFNYSEQSAIRGLSDRDKLGIKVAFASNSFAAYRRDALCEVGGFPTASIFGEDFIVAAKMLRANWKVAYCAEAAVFHSHDYTIFQEFRRYFDIGVMHSRERWILELLGGASGEGARYLRSELAFVARRRPSAIPGVLLCAAAKLLGYRLGLIERHLNNNLKRRISMHGSFWKTE